MAVRLDSSGRDVTRGLSASRCACAVAIAGPAGRRWISAVTTAAPPPVRCGAPDRRRQCRRRQVGTQRPAGRAPLCECRGEYDEGQSVLIARHPVEQYRPCSTRGYGGGCHRTEHGGGCTSHREAPGQVGQPGPRIARSAWSVRCQWGRPGIGARRAGTIHARASVSMTENLTSGSGCSQRSAATRAAPDTAAASTSGLSSP